jgi:hypothetical protein
MVLNSEKSPREMTAEEIQARIIQLGFGGDRTRFEIFCEKLRQELPPKTGVALRGSVVTAERWKMALLLMPMGQAAAIWM